MKVTNKWILITGASTGIGRATAEYLASKEFSIYACARKDSDIKELNEIENVTAVKLDVTDEFSILEAVKFIKESKSGLYAVINNAGITKVGPLMDLPTQDIVDQFDVNLFGVHRVTRAIFPLLLESKGKIIMISSNSGFFAAPFVGPYCSSKFALEGYSDSLRRELLLYGVKVIIIQPGRIKTQIWNKAKEAVNSFANQTSIFEKEARAIGEYSIKKGQTESLSPIKVAELIYKVLITNNPKTRYLIVPDKFRNKMLRILSDKRIDRILEKELSKLKQE
jgi:short-subunit dehydrogenase